jgi:hypothetical protein
LDLLTSLTPVLPSDAWLRWAKPMMWSVVLTAVLAWLGLQATRTRRLPMQPWLALAMGFAVLVANLMPGGWSPSYWLSLAFNLPSWSLILLCAAWLVTKGTGWADGQREAEASVGVKNAINSRAGCGHLSWIDPLFDSQIKLSMLGLVLGVVLLGDTISLWPSMVSIYAWGFSALAVAAAALALAMAWVFSPAPSWQRPWVMLLSCAVLLHVATRLPTGNLWDALIDPWLWAFCVAAVLRRLIRAARQGNRGLPPGRRP